ncbi:putative transposase gene of IS605 family insertion sequence ISY052a [Trichodesmium erythraeum IMS101]|uniref:Putative transposase gene of IS605 family insertion sequence ISY052a n=1 Tax=Trichodesmium erythraeum (strain IMS101) TaxID=203124 RepID=Q118Y4_TRIEI|nr:transposase [Trichodesmium erythraeum GBRTRLIN201]MCH2048833.1 transposase [Trichodesmium sp. ALOHA_ZT_67]MDE5096499.1 transposase [Trichodesmium sp. St11_bin5]MDT9341982.1 transposase [Trichodesmium erythraeum 21-75]
MAYLQKSFFHDSIRYYSLVEINRELLPQTDNSVDIDLGIKTFTTLSNSKKIDAPKPLKKLIKKYILQSKSLFKKCLGSKRYEKARLKVTKFHNQLKDTRYDFLHKLLTSIINYNQIIVLEVSNVSEMLKKWCNLAIIIVARKNAPKHSQLSKAISDLS